MDWAQILVIILAILFAIFLFLAIVLAVFLVMITRQIKAATASASRTMSVIEDSVQKANKAALPMMIAKGIFKQVRKKSPRIAKQKEVDEQK